MSHEFIAVEKKDHLTIITLNRPERMNAISGPMLSGLSAALVDCDKDPEVRAACLGALRFNAHGDVVPLLLKQARNKKLLGEPAAAEAYYYALGQSADPRALAVLGDGLRDALDPKLRGKT